MSNVLAYLFDDYRKQQNARLFKNLLYGFLIIKCFFWLTNFDILFGEHAVSLTFDAPLGFFKKLAYFIYSSNNTSYAMIFIYVVLALSIGSLFSKKTNVVVDILIYILVLNLDTRVYTTSTAGESLLVNLCFLSAFLQKYFSKGTGIYNQLKIVFHNVSFFALALQVCILYGYSALAKWYDVDWVNGEAVYLTIKAWHYSRSVIVNSADSFHFLTVIITYVLLLYQSLFPFVVWIKKAKKYFLHIGIIMHLYIAFVMGLFFFGIIMIITYALFYDIKSTSGTSD